MIGRGIYKCFIAVKIRNVSLFVAKKLGESFPECHTIVIEIMCDVKGGIWIQDTVLHLPISKWRSISDPYHKEFTRFLCSRYRFIY